jgi:hypothetical protein
MAAVMKARMWVGVAALVLIAVIVNRVGFNVSLIVSLLSVPAVFYCAIRAAGGQSVSWALMTLAFLALVFSLAVPKLVLVTIALVLVALFLDFRKRVLFMVSKD